MGIFFSLAGVGFAGAENKINSIYNSIAGTFIHHRELCVDLTVETRCDVQSIVKHSSSSSTSRVTLCDDFLFCTDNLLVL